MELWSELDTDMLCSLSSKISARLKPLKSGAFGAYFSAPFCSSETCSDVSPSEGSILSAIEFSSDLLSSSRLNSLSMIFSSPKLFYELGTDVLIFGIINYRPFGLLITFSNLFLFLSYSLHAMLLCGSTMGLTFPSPVRSET